MDKSETPSIEDTEKKQLWLMMTVGEFLYFCNWKQV
jgi:hypothetical protein